MQNSIQNRYSTLKTSIAKIGNKFVTVEQLLGRKNRQDIAYRVNGGNVLTTDEFFAQKPKFQN
jgi:hypothetical protein